MLRGHHTDFINNFELRLTTENAYFHKKGAWFLSFWVNDIISKYESYYYCLKSSNILKWMSLLLLILILFVLSKISLPGEPNTLFYPFVLNFYEPMMRGYRHLTENQNLWLWVKSPPTPAIVQPQSENKSTRHPES